MNTYAIILFLHILSAAALVGGSIVAASLVRVGARRARTYDELRAVLSLGAPLRILNPATALALLGTGVYLASLLHWWALAWVRMGATIWIVNVLIAAWVVGPHMGRLAAETVGRDGPVTGTADRLRWAARWTVGSGVLMANDVAVILIMVLKPALGASLLIVAAANLLLLGALGLLSTWRAHGRRRPLALQH
jgi:uncharacterized membrane protein